MFNQRTDPRFRYIKESLPEIGAIRRIHWTITTWFRTEAYYNSGGWRATWSGVGGGVLLNQSPHNLDIFQWLFGMPAKVRAHCQFGRYHDIEVEDSVTAYLEYPDSTTATFIVTTGESPGENRLEIVGDLGRIVLDGRNITIQSNQSSTGEFSRQATNSYARPPFTETASSFDSPGTQHNGIITNFVEAVFDGTPLIAPAAEGVRSLELANAMLMSTFLDRTIELPMDADHYQELLMRRISSSNGHEKLARNANRPAPNNSAPASCHPSYCA